jgi:very-short-patch-repair endonuclease
MAPDAILGNVVVRVNGKWFAIGECRKSSDVILYDAQGKLLLESVGFEVMRLWSPFYVLVNIKRMETSIRSEISVEG